MTQPSSFYRNTYLRYDLLGENPQEGVAFTGFKEENLTRMISEGHPKVCDFFRLLSLCHTIQPEEVDGKIVYQVRRNNFSRTKSAFYPHKSIYQAQSPDEKALTEAARYA